jgi:hypothetical protein
MSAIRRFILPVVVVFGSMLAFGGVVAGVAAAQGPDPSSEIADEVAGEGDSGSDGSSDDPGETGGEATEAASPGDEGGGDGGDDGEDATDGEEASSSTALPASCGSLFSASMRANVEGAGLALNPSWASGTNAADSIADSNLRSQLSGLTKLSCRWLNPAGGGEVGVDTTVASVTSSQATAINSRLASLGYSSITELGGVRYVWEVGYSADSYPQGESHLVRDGLYFATHWLNYGPSGYTADMVHNVFG